MKAINSSVYAAIQLALDKTAKTSPELSAYLETIPGYDSNGGKILDGTAMSGLFHYLTDVHGNVTHVTIKTPPSIEILNPDVEGPDFLGEPVLVDYSLDTEVPEQVGGGAFFPGAFTLGDDGEIVSGGAVINHMPSYTDDDD